MLTLDLLDQLPTKELHPNHGRKKPPALSKMQSNLTKGVKQTFNEVNLKLRRKNGPPNKSWGGILILRHVIACRIFH